MEKLIIYQSAQKLVLEVYKLVFSSEPLRRNYGLVDQTRRASVSVVLNIAEGYGRGIKYFKNSLSISIGSINEVRAALQIIEVIYNVPTIQLQQ